MSILKGLTAAARVLTTEGFRRGTQPSVDASDFMRT